MDTTPMTKNGALLLRQELDTLKNKKRPAIITAISEARAHGDLKENAEYHAAKDQQGFIEGRIQELEAKLGTAQIIDVSEINQNGRVVFGTTITLLNVTDEQTVRYQIVGEDEVDVDKQKISYKAPIAKALLGKQAGDEVLIRVPKGEICYEILTVEYC